MRISKDNAYGMYCFLIGLKVAKVDGHLDENEKDFLIAQIKKYEVVHLEKFVKGPEELHEFFAKNHKQMDQSIKKIADTLPFKKRLMGLALAAKMAAADGSLKEVEKDALVQIGKIVGLSKRQSDSFIKSAKREILEVKLEIEQAVEGLTGLQREAKKQQIISLRFGGKENLKCPYCKDVNLETFEHDHFAFDFCEKGCHGVWADGGELALSLSEDKAQMPTAQMDVIEEGELTSRDCPRCIVPLYQLEFLKGTEIWVDKCPECRGIWFDGGELAQVHELAQKAGISGNLTAAVGVLKERGIDFKKFKKSS